MLGITPSVLYQISHLQWLWQLGNADVVFAVYYDNVEYDDDDGGVYGIPQLDSPWVPSIFIVLTMKKNLCSIHSLLPPQQLTISSWSYPFSFSHSTILQHLQVHQRSHTDDTVTVSSHRLESRTLGWALLVCRVHILLLCSRFWIRRKQWSRRWRT